MKDTLARLRALLPVEESSAPHIDWRKVEADIGSGIPPDYKAMIDTFGGGAIDEYLLLLEPHSPHPAYDFKRVTDERDAANAILWDYNPPPPDVSESNARLIPWATTDNGEYLYWAALGNAAPEEWKVLINDASSAEWERYAMTCTEFLAAALGGDISSDLLWSRFPLEEHSFRSTREIQRPSHVVSFASFL